MLFAVFEGNFLEFDVLNAVKSAVIFKGNGAVRVIHNSNGYLLVSCALCLGLNGGAVKGSGELKFAGKTVADNSTVFARIKL